MKVHLPAHLICLFAAATLAAGCAPSTQSTTTDDEPTTTSRSDAEIPPEKQAELQKVFCAETLAYLARTSDEPAPNDCKAVIMRPTDQFGHGDSEGYLVTVIVGEDRKKIELGAVVEPGGEVKLRSLQSELERAAAQETELEIRNVRSMVDTYYLQADPKRLPDHLQELVDQNISDQVPTDPWGTPYVYEKQSPTDFEVYSAGPDRQPGTIDDVHVE